MPVPNYPKVLTYGHQGTENVFTGQILVEEKIDGSQIGFGFDEDGILCIRSHNQQIPLDQGIEVIPKMFRTAVRIIEERMTEKWERFFYGSMWIYGEYLEGPHHNVLSYDRTPEGHIVLFDAILDGYWALYSELLEIAELLGFECVPLLFAGEVANSTALATHLCAKPLLGGEIVEGVVVKNYHQLISLNGQVTPVFAKIVNEKFQESHGVTWNKLSPIQAVLESVSSEARWAKAVQRRLEAGELLNAPQDIGPLLKSIQIDFEAEEADDIARLLYKALRKDVLKAVTKGFAQWYKDRLVERADALAGKGV